MTTQRHFGTRWLGALGFVLSLVGLASQGATSAQTPLAATRQSADQGDAQAQFNLGLMYDLGQGIPEDDAEAAAWYRKAADQGIAGAQYNLGLMYRNGDGVPRDFTQAAAWYRKAADQGHAFAQYTLGLSYAYGLGVPRDYVEAHKWHALAASRVTGDTQKDYIVLRDAMAKQITPAQLAEARERAADWQAAFEERQPD